MQSGLWLFGVAVLALTFVSLCVCVRVPYPLWRRFTLWRNTIAALIPVWKGVAVWGLVFPWSAMTISFIVWSVLWTYGLCIFMVLIMRRGRSIKDVRPVRI